MRIYTCIVCPNGCEITADDSGGELVLSGALCRKGGEYVRQEMIDPRRTISSLVKVEGGDRPLASVRITTAIPRDRIGDAMRQIKSLSCRAPVAAGQVLDEDFLGLGCRLVVTDSVSVLDA